MNPLIHKIIILSILFTNYLVATDFSEYLIKLSPQNLYKARNTENTDSLLTTLSKSKNIINTQKIFSLNDDNLDSWILVTVGKDKASVIQKLYEQKQIIDYQENNNFKTHSLDRDPLYHQQWYLRAIKAAEAEINFSPVKPVLLAVIDTGIDYRHPDLTGSLWINQSEDINGNGMLDLPDFNGVDEDGNGYVDDVSGWDFTDAPRFPDGGDFKDPDNDPMDEFQSGHGTQIAGIIAARPENGIGIHGIAYGIKILNLRAGTSAGYLEEDDVARAVIYAVENDARVINMSFGDVVVSRFLRDVIHYAYQKDVVLIASAGNSGTNEIHYPAGFPQTISVGATADSVNLAGFSSWGQTIDLVAPGSGIVSTSIGNAYNTVNGTSFSAPMVAAAAALLISKYPQWTNEEIRNVLKLSSEDLGYNGWDEFYGAGSLDLFAASQIESGSILKIDSPATGSYVANDSIYIVVTVQDKELLYFSLQYGIGQNPDQWNTLVANRRYQVIQDTVALLDIGAVEDTTIILRIMAKNWKSGISETRSFLHIDKTAPHLINFTKKSMLNRNRYAMLLSFECDDIISGEVYYRKAGTNDPYSRKIFEYETRKQKLLINSDEISGNVEFYLRLKNLSGLVSKIFDNQRFVFEIPDLVIPSFNFTPLSYSLPAGYMLPVTTDFDNDGNGEIILSVYDTYGAFGPVEIHEYENGRFVKRYQSPFRAIPRFTGDSDNDGKQELILGYGKNSFILENSEFNYFDFELVWADSSDFWISRITDLDNDNKNEIIGKSGDSYLLLESNGNNSYQLIYEFSNLSKGENLFGPPETIVADFDDDGKAELLFGDYDGDIIIYENTGDDAFKENFNYRLPLEDATEYFISGRFLQDEKHSFIAGTHSSDDINYEHEFNALYWNFGHFLSPANDAYNLIQNINIYGYYSTKEYDSGFASGQLSDQSTSIFLVPYPHMYIFQTNGDSLVPVYFSGNVNTNTIIAHDFNKNGISEIFFNDGSKIKGYEPGEKTNPQAPSFFRSIPLDTSHILLTWNKVPGSDKYRIYRGISEKELTLYDSTITQSTFMDSSLNNHTTYFYAVTNVDNDFIANESFLSTVDSAQTNFPPTVISAAAQNRNQVIINFSEKMNEQSFVPVFFNLSQFDITASSAVSSRNGYAVLVSFDDDFIPDSLMQLKIGELSDVDKTPLLESSRDISFVYSSPVEKPYVSEWNIISKNRISIKYNTSMDSVSVLNKNNYNISPKGQILAIMRADQDYKKFEINISADNYIGSSGITSYLIIKNVLSKYDNSETVEQEISLTEQKNNLDNILVYPQPAYSGEEKLTFANITINTEINIYDIHGNFIVKLSEKDYNGGIIWNLKNNKGEKVSSGIYIYFARNENESKTGKFTIVR